MKAFLIILTCVFWFIVSCTIDQFDVNDLKCEYLKDPCAIDVQNPRLSWTLNSDSDGQKQTAYHILVASSEKILEEETGDLWNTGKIKSDQSVHIVYQGEELMSRQKVFWKVRTWDRNEQASQWSRTASWEMGLNQSDWQAEWIGLAEYKKRKPEERNPAIYFRKRTEFSNPINKGRAYISGLGYYELYINGEKVGDHVLSPNHTNYDRRQSPADFDEPEVGIMSTRVLYETWNIKSFLQHGENIFEVCLGNGWYFQNEREEDLPYTYDTPRFIAQIELEFVDGTSKCMMSDDSWEASFGPILHNGLYSGEIYDARLKEKNWEKTIVVRPPEGKLKAQMSPPDRVTRTIKPVFMTIPSEGIYRYDLGEMISGWAKLKVSGPRGTVITMKFIEEAGPAYGQTDSYILKGSGSEIWEPRFTWHAFRYIEVSSPIPLTQENITGVIVNTDVNSAGSFQCSNELFNKILENFRRTQLGNMHGGIPSDCPHRERRGYTGDGQIAAQAAIFNFDMASFYTKWMNDLKDAQNTTSGYVPNTVPFQSGGGGTAWGSAYVIIPWFIYLYYGDVSILEQHYSGMKNWIDYLTRLTDRSGIINEEKLGEWVPPDATEIPSSFVSTAYYYYDLMLMSEIAGVLKDTEDTRYFKDLAKLTKEAFNKKYYQEKSKSYSIGRQGANVFALGFGLVPEARIEEVFKSLVRNIESNTDEHFDTGMMGTPLALDVLTRYGRVDLAYSMMNQHDYPGFGYAIDQGATTIWETWRGDASHSHPMFGSVCQWFYQALAGINPDPEQPGFKNIIMKPQPVSTLKYVKATHTSVYGDIESGWEWKENDLVFNLAIPVNSTATVILPAAEQDDVTINNRSIRKSKDVSLIEFKDNVAKYQVESGHYSFIMKNVRSLIQVSRLSVPKIIPADSILFINDTATVQIFSREENVVIRYTLNGDEPNENSPFYSKPFKINGNTIIKARVYKDGYKPGSYTTSSVSFVAPESGLSYQYYSGQWEKIPDFASLLPESSGYIYKIGLDHIPFKFDKFGLVLKGAIEIPSTALYTFYLNSNDGSNLYIDGKLIVENDGLHGALEREGQIQLSRGRHSFRIDYFQAGGGFHLNVDISSPGIERVNISPSMLFRSMN
ncbi:MAG: family 78 glycoside hydrolase catalytic domain [Bacteroidota bacterium]|nr:family 78 glycoside hydrolase catalytic domain [Bacteroidota bacterium]